MSDMLTLRRDMASLIVAAIKNLLETKHLYQAGTAFDLDAFIDANMAAMPMPEPPGRDQDYRRYSAIQAARANLRRAACQPWLPIQSYGPEELEKRQRAGQADMASPLLFEFPFVRLYCRRCHRREPYHALSVSDALEDERPRPDPDAEPTMTDQIFLALYQCQGCRSAPEFLAVARNGMKVKLVGRQPIESVEVPDEVPREESEFLRSARIAFNTGNVLAALFYLRTLIEQFARRKTNRIARETGDVLMSKYSATLPDDLRGRMPSLGEWYEKLSEALHEARDDEELYRAAEEKILHHFELRRAARLD